MLSNCAPCCVSEWTAGSYMRLFIWCTWLLNCGGSVGFTVTGLTVLKGIGSQSFFSAGGQDISTNFQTMVAGAIIIGIIASLGFTTLNVLLLTIHTFGKAGPGFSYGFVMACAVQAALTQVLVGLELQFVVKYLNNNYPNASVTDVTSWNAVFYFAYISAAAHALSFIFLSVAEGISSDPGGTALYRPGSDVPVSTGNTFKPEPATEMRSVAIGRAPTAPAPAAASLSPAEENPFARM